MIEISYKSARLEYDRNIRKKGSNIARKERAVERKVVRKSTLKVAPPKVVKRVRKLYENRSQGRTEKHKKRRVKNCPQR